MKRGIGPIAQACDEAVLERIDITILDVARVIRFVTYQMFPEPALPDAALVACMRRRIAQPGRAGRLASGGICFANPSYLGIDHESCRQAMIIVTENLVRISAGVR
jgi:hypothetical protein